MKRTGIHFTLILTALLALSGLAQEVAAQRLGRLFTSNDERARLDSIRHEAQFAQRPPAPEPEPEPEPQAVAPAPVQPSGPTISRLTINGVVRRSGGPGTVWVNGDRVDGGETTREGIAVDSARTGTGGVRLRLPSGTDTVALRPGQQIDIETGTVVEAYETTTRGEGGSAFASAPSPGSAPAPPPATAPRPAGAAPGRDDAAQGESPAAWLDDPALRDAIARGIVVLPPAAPAAPRQ